MCLCFSLGIEKCGVAPNTKPVDFHKDCPDEYPISGPECIYGTVRTQICCCKRYNELLL